ncbi:UDP-3-O-acyl-N-acetylglucosamine deacetylase [bacterium HR17]|uniref:UDP-3-O-acyl-N-acetylglucosamine deacetylase n=1 Tax=Candidatus Fervidibacter japonicus TaxID=2035412 RepID=A0A2H5XG94_9BACT|nr:UDP-3-O-acyl-N-acetylglucosamine deacetylase [bacterium HR17]
MQRKTLGRCERVRGTGLHTGERVTATLHPAEAGTGIVLRVRRQGESVIPALVPFVADTRRRVVLQKDGVAVQTVEHLLAACFGMGVTDLLVEVDGGELPIGDGSAQLWVDAFTAAGIVVLDEPAPVFPPLEAITVHDDAAFVRVEPADAFRARYVFVTAHPLVGVQEATFNADSDDFATAVAPARTFGFIEEVQGLWQQNLAKGGRWDNAVIVFPDRYSVPLRFPNELARHKLLDLMGDLMLLGVQLCAAVTAHASGHRLHYRVCQTLWHMVAQEAKGRWS